MGIAYGDVARVRKSSDYKGWQLSNLQILRYRRITHPDSYRELALFSEHPCSEPLPKHRSFLKGREVRANFIFTVHFQHKVARLGSLAVDQGENGKSSLHLSVERQCSPVPAMPRDDLEIDRRIINN